MATGATRVHRLDSAGAGFTFALIHGMADTWDSWYPFAEYADPAWRVFALDMPWRLGAEAGWGVVGSPAQWISRGLCALPAVDVLVGHSFGACAVLQYLAGHPCSSLRAAVLLAPAFLPQNGDSDQISAECRSLVDVLLEQLVRDKASAGQYVADDIAKEISVVTAADLWAQSSAEITALVGATGSLALQQVSVPTVVVVDSEDPVLAGGRAQALLRAMPSSQIRLKNRFGHFFHRQRADVVVSDIKDFLAQQYSGSDIGFRERSNSMSSVVDNSLTVRLQPRLSDACFWTIVNLTGVVGLGQAAVRHWFCGRDMGPQRLREDYGLAFRVVRSQARLAHFVGLDDEVIATVTERRPGAFSVELTVDRDGSTVAAMTGQYDVVLTRDSTPGVSVPGRFLSLVSDDVAHSSPNPGGSGISLPIAGSPEETLAAAYPRASRWELQIPLNYCCHARWLTHEACLTIFEDADSRFRREHEITVARIAVEHEQTVAAAAVRHALITPAYIDEQLYVCYRPTDVFRSRGYDVRMDCFIERDGLLVQAASTRVTYACARLHDRTPVELCEFHPSVVNVLREFQPEPVIQRIRNV